MKALLYRRGALGDTLLTFPLLEIMKRQGYTTVAVGNTDYFKIAQQAGWADKVFTNIPEEPFDLKIVISSESNIKPFPSERIWIVDYYLRKTGFEGFPFSRELPLTYEDSPLVNKIVLHPSSGSTKKNPPLEVFLEIESYLKIKGYDVIYFIGEADSWLKSKVSEFYECFDPCSIAKALKGSLLFIGLDSGISHLAAYVGIPTVVIYGPSDPLIWKPIGRKVYQITPPLQCAPCFPKICDERRCFDVFLIFKRLFPLLDHILININKDYLS